MARPGWNRNLLALLGRPDSPTDGVRDYCALLSEALSRRGASFELGELPWEKQGWVATLWKLWQESVAWQGRWVLIQYTALSWSRRGFPIGVLAVLGILKARGCRSGVVFHELGCAPSSGWLGRLRMRCQEGVVQGLFRWADRSISTVSLELVRLLAECPEGAVFIPVGANLPISFTEADSWDRAESFEKTIAIYGITGGAHIPREVADVGYAVKRARRKVEHLRLVVLGRGSEDAEPMLRREFAGTDVDVSVLGLLPADEVARVLSQAEVLLFVRGQVSSRRSSAIAAVACGLPIVGYEGPETGPPITEAGVQLVPLGDRQALAEALCRVLTSESLWQELHERSLRAQAEHFSWDVIAARYVRALEETVPRVAGTEVRSLAEESVPAESVTRK